MDRLLFAREKKEQEIVDSLGKWQRDIRETLVTQERFPGDLAEMCSGYFGIPDCFGFEVHEGTPERLQELLLYNSEELQALLYGWPFIGFYYFVREVSEQCPEAAFHFRRLSTFMAWLFGRWPNCFKTWKAFRLLTYAVPQVTGTPTYRSLLLTHCMPIPPLPFTNVVDLLVLIQRLGPPPPVVCSTLHSQMMHLYLTYRPKKTINNPCLPLCGSPTWNSVEIYEALWFGVLTNPSFLSPLLDAPEMSLIHDVLRPYAVAGNFSFSSWALWALGPNIRDVWIKARAYPPEHLALILDVCPQPILPRDIHLLFTSDRFGATPFSNSVLKRYGFDPANEDKRSFEEKRWMQDRDEFYLSFDEGKEVKLERSASLQTAPDVYFLQSRLPSLLMIAESTGTCDAVNNHQARPLLLMIAESIGICDVWDSQQAILRDRRIGIPRSVQTARQIIQLTYKQSRSLREFYYHSAPPDICLEAHELVKAVKGSAEPLRIIFSVVAAKHPALHTQMTMLYKRIDDNNSRELVDEVLLLIPKDLQLPFKAFFAIKRLI